MFKSCFAWTQRYLIYLLPFLANWDVWLACDSTGFELSCHKSQYFSLICSNNHLSISMEKKRSITLKLQTLLRKDEKRVNKYTLFVHIMSISARLELN